MDNGKDVIEGGALYNSTGVSITGLADVVDSISAIEKYVYQDKTLSMKDLLEALKANFEGREDLKTMLQKKAPKFGTADPIADENARRMVKFLHDNYQQHTNYRDGKYTVGYWTMTMHAGFGMLMGATPNGREAGESFSSGITPVSGATKGLTACLNSVASLDKHYLANGVALNLKYTPDADRKLMLDSFSDTVEAYFRDGGIQVQFNIITRKMLTDIMDDPQHAPDVLVRVSGYTAYFKDLSKQMKREVINRTEYNLRTMEAEDYPWV